MRKMMAIGVGMAVAAFSTAAMAEDAKPAGGAAAASTSDPGGMKISAAALVGYGVNSFDVGTEKLNLYGLGFGVRAGVSLPSNIYVGGTFIYHLGATKEYGSGPSAAKVTLGMSYYGLEGGYNISSGSMTIRPYLGLGQVKLHGETCFGSICGASESKAETYIAPGVAVLFPVGTSLFAGVDARMVRVMTGDGDKAQVSSLPSVFGTVGMNF